MSTFLLWMLPKSVTFFLDFKISFTSVNQTQKGINKMQLYLRRLPFVLFVQLHILFSIWDKLRLNQ